MTRYRLFLVSTAVLLSACATPSKQLVMTLAAADLSCSEAELTLSRTSRPFIGMSNYDVSGCNRKSSYACDRWHYGVAVGTTGDVPPEPICKLVR